MYTERIVHLLLRIRGAQIPAQPCPGCNIQHREFFAISAVGGLLAFVQIIGVGIQFSGAMFTIFYCPYTIQSVVDEYIYLKECLGDTELTRGFYDTLSRATHADTLTTPWGAVHALLAMAALGGFTNSGARQLHVGGGAGCT
ncbi:hypothetical protein FB451DRAFT_1193478 [Mycena latifolia]|nr:hypothetical protein FB451DRAFT_1193478 [Mycena latifolia]